MADTNGNGNGHPPWYLRVLEKHGLATVLVVFLMWQVVLPMKDGMLEQMKSATATTKEQTAINKVLADAVAEMKEASLKQVHLLERIDTGIDEQAAALEQIESAVRTSH